MRINILVLLLLVAVVDAFGVSDTSHPAARKYNRDEGTNARVLNPNHAYDVTMEDTSGQEVPKILVEVKRIKKIVPAIIGKYPRLKVTKECQRDNSHNTEYCPISLTQCAEEWEYTQGYSVAHQVQTAVVPSACPNGFELISNKCVKRYEASPYAPPLLLGGKKCKMSPVMYTYNKVPYVYCTNGGVPLCRRGELLVTINGWRKVCLTNRYYCYLGGKLVYQSFFNNYCEITTCPPGYTMQSDGSCIQSYTYYTYHCPNQPNYQGFNWIVQNPGGDCKAPNCNSPTPPQDNCKRKRFACRPNSENPCAYINGSWQCSPYRCQDSKCGVAYCNSAQEAINGATDQNICALVACDMTKPYNQFCGSAQTRCPFGYEVQSSNNQTVCYKMDCPPDAQETPEGKCQALRCPSGSTQNSAGKCITN